MSITCCGTWLAERSNHDRTRRLSLQPQGVPAEFGHRRISAPACWHGLGFGRRPAGRLVRPAYYATKTSKTGTLSAPGRVRKDSRLPPTCTPLFLCAVTGPLKFALT